MNTKQQGDVGVAMAIAYYTRSGYTVSMPLTDNSRYDLLVEMNGKIDRVQCKTSTYEIRPGRFEVALRTKGGNQSGQASCKWITSQDADLLFVYADNVCYEIPVDLIAGSASVRVGSEKWMPYAVWHHMGQRS